MNEEWHSSAPGGRDVIVQRRGELWLVRCGDVHVLNGNLDVALMRAIRADLESAAHSDEADYPAWARAVANEIDSAA
jgi:hypothetical protein